MNAETLRDRLLEKTNNPRDLSGWVNRIGFIAHCAGLDIAQICWVDTPRVVALETVKLAQKEGKLEVGPRVRFSPSTKLLPSQKFVWSPPRIFLY